MTRKKKNLSVFGLGKLGAPMLAVFAEKGFNVIGCDTSEETVNQINSGAVSIQETGLHSLLNKNLSKISATTDFNEAISNSDASFIIVPTPSNDDDFFDNSFVLNCVKNIGKALKEKTGYHLVVVTSTVMPGSMEAEIKPTLEEFSGKTIGKNLGLCYNPEFIALGTVIEDMLNPDILLIGESDEKAGLQLEAILCSTYNTKPVIHRMNFEEAELSKIAINSFVTTKISYANMLANMCEKVGNASIDKVSAALGDDSRIGHKYLRGGVAFGGPCFPRDNKAFVALGNQLGVKTNLAFATDQINEFQTQRLSAFVLEHVETSKLIGIFGCSYKPNTPVTEESPGLKLMEDLSNLGYRGLITDEQATHAGNENFIFETDLRKAVKTSDCIILMTTEKKYSEINLVIQEIDAGLKKIIIDPWRMLNKEIQPLNVTLITPGDSS